MSETLFGGITFDTTGGYPLSTDTVVLADFVRLSPHATVCDLGLGSGALTLLLKDRHKHATFCGIELDKTACETAKHNFQSNQLKGSCTAYLGDLRQIQSILPANGFTHVVSNPPYFPLGSGHPHSSMQVARGEDCCTLQDLCKAASWLLSYGGTFSLVYRPERLCDLIWELRSYKLEPKRIQFVRHRPNSAVSLVLIEAKAGGKPSLSYLPDLVLYDQTGNPTTDYIRIYRLEGANT